MTKLVFYRRELQLNQAEFACAIKIPRWRLQLIECGATNPTPEERAKIAAVLNEPEEKIFSSFSTTYENKKTV